MPMLTITTTPQRRLHRRRVLSFTRPSSAPPPLIPPPSTPAFEPQVTRPPVERDCAVVVPPPAGPASKDEETSYRMSDDLEFLPSAPSGVVFKSTTTRQRHAKEKAELQDEMNRLRARLLKTEAMLAEAQERDEARELLAIKPTGSAGAVAGDDCADPVVILAKERTARKAAEAEAKAAQATVAMLVKENTAHVGATDRLRVLNDRFRAHVKTVSDQLECGICLERFLPPPADLPSEFIPPPLHHRHLFPNGWPGQNVTRVAKTLRCGHTFCCLPLGNDCPLRCDNRTDGNAQRLNRALVGVLQAIKSLEDEGVV